MNADVKRIKVLMVEDTPADAELIVDVLTRANYDPDWTRVETEDEFRNRIEKRPDIILADYNLPRFDGLRALRILREHALDIPFIVISGSVGEDVAVECIKEGATDYLLKDRLGRLGMSVSHALEEKRQRTEFHRAEQALRDAEQKYRDIFENVSEGIYQTTPEGRFISANPAAAKMFGYDTPEQLIRGVTDVARGYVDPGVRAAFKRKIERDGFVREFEHQSRRKDGTLMWVSSNARCVRDEEGKLLYYEGTLTDITDRKKTEEALKRSQSRFSTIFRAGPVAISINRVLDGHLIDVNDRYCAFFGYRRSELIGHSIIDLQLWADPNERTPLIVRLLQEGSIQGFETKYRRETGEIRDVLASYELIDLEGEDQRVMISMFVDITERKKSEEKIQEQARLLDLAQDAIIVRSLDHKIVYWNHGAEQLYGWRASEATGKAEPDLLYRDTTAYQEANAQLVIKGEWSGELQHVIRGGSEVTVNSRWNLVRDTYGNPSSVLVINTDVTDKKRFETQFLRSQRLEGIGALASGISHDLNNVLAPILMVSEVLQHRSFDSETMAMLKTVETSARRGADVVGQLLTYARGAEGKRTTIQIRYLFRDIVLLLRPTLPKNIAITTKSDPNVASINGDPTQLHQVLLNLCVNARDAMPEGGKLILSAENVATQPPETSHSAGEKPGPFVLIRVQDTGHGIPKGILDRIFEPFFTTKAPGKGTGLGLSTVHGIVKGHGGFVCVDSTMGKGTTFSLYLPAVVGPISQSTNNGVTAAPPRGRGETILVVDDETPIREVVKSMLTEHGYHVLTAADGTEGVATYACNRTQVRLILTDIMMPNLSGIHLIKILKKLDPGVKIIAATGARSGPLNTSNRIELQTLGVTTLLDKPYSTQQLLTALREVLDLP